MGAPTLSRSAGSNQAGLCAIPILPPAHYNKGDKTYINVYQIK